MARIWLMSVLAVIGIAMGPVAASADSVDDVIALLKTCRGPKASEAKCADELWRFADVTTDDRLSLAEMSRLLRISAEALLKIQAADQPAGGSPMERITEDDLFMAAATGFFSAPFAAHLLLANFDYDDDGLLTRSEVFHDLTDREFQRLVVEESQKLPQRAGTLFLRALQAQQGIPLGGPPQAE